jgi:hypothetical protein
MSQKKSPGSVKRILSLAVLITGFLVFLGCLYAIIFLPLRLNTALVQGMKIIRIDPVVAEMFGAPILQRLFVTGKLGGFHYGNGVGNLETSISGSKEIGDATFFMSKPRGSSWQLERMVI